MVIHHNDIILERSLLCESRLNSIGYGLGTITYRYDDRCLVFELCPFQIYIRYSIGRDVCTDTFQVLGTNLLHLYLHFAVLRIDIIKLLLTTLSEVNLFFCVKIFPEMKYRVLRHLTKHIQRQFIPSCISPVAVGMFFHTFTQLRSRNQLYGTKVKIIAHTTPTQVNLRFLHQLTVLL